MKKIVIGITAPGSIVLLEGQLKYFSEKGYKTYLLAPDTDRVRAYCEREKCELLPVDIARDISLKQDMRSLKVILGHLRRVKPDVVNVGTPKMGLLGMIAARLTGVPNRIYTCRGFRFEHEQGMKKKILVFMDRLAASSAHTVICISDSVRTLGVSLNIFPQKKAVVISKGSSNGIDLNRFSPEKVNKTELEALRASLQLQEHFVFGFVGRLIDRKGIKELYLAFDKIYKTNNNVRLLIVGPVEAEQISDKDLLKNIAQHPGIILTGGQTNVPLYLSLMDVFVLPAWWEGFGNVLVQAAAMQVPVISTNATGSKDAVSDGFNGILVTPKSVDELHEKMLLLMQNAALRNELGTNGAAWAKNFDSQIIWKGMERLYNQQDNHVS